MTTRLTTYGRTHRVGRTYPGDLWNPACDRQDPRVAIPSASGTDIRPPRAGDLACDQPACEVTA